MSTYKGQTPSDLAVDSRIVAFFERFYAVSDDPAAHEEYAQSFTPDADFAMGSKKVAGYADILALRHGLWSGPVRTRKHTLEKIFPFGRDSNELMLYGSVFYELKNGKDITVDWAARAVMTEYQGALRFKLYQVYLVCCLCPFFSSCPTLLTKDKMLMGQILSTLLGPYRSRQCCKGLAVIAGESQDGGLCVFLILGMPSRFHQSIEAQPKKSISSFLLGRLVVLCYIYDHSLVQLVPGYFHACSCVGISEPKAQTSIVHHPPRTSIKVAISEDRGGRASLV